MDGCVKPCPVQGSTYTRLYGKQQLERSWCERKPKKDREKCAVAVKRKEISLGTYGEDLESLLSVPEKEGQHSVQLVAVGGAKLTYHKEGSRFSGYCS